MDLEWFKNLTSLARTGSFSRAAEADHISQSAFSRRIKALEGWVGTSLVDRSSYPVKLTEAGRQILEAGGQAINRLETERAHIRESLEQPDKYVVSFGTQHSIGWRFFPAWLQSFEKEFGPIISRLRADNLPNCLADLHRGEVDFVISYESAHARSVEETTETVSLVIGEDQFIPVCMPGADGLPLFPVDGDRPLSIPYLRFGPSAPIGRHIDPILAASDLSVRLTSVYENSMVGALRIRARDGLGVAWLPRSLVQSDIDAGLLTIAGSEPLWIDVEVQLHRLRRNQNDLILRIWDHLSRGKTH